MKKTITAMLLGVALASAAVTPARAEPLAAAVLGIIAIGSPLLVDMHHKGLLPATPAVCEVEHVKAENGNYVYRRVVDDGKGCTLSS